MALLMALIGSDALWAQQGKTMRAAERYEAAETYFNEARYPDAIVQLNQCLLDEPGYSDAYYLRARAREQMKDYAGALTDYSIFLEQRPDQPEVLFSRGILRYQLKKYEQAREDFQRLLQLPPGETQTIHFNKAARVGGANQILTTQSSTAPLIYNYLGMVDMALRNYKGAIAWLDSAILLDPREADYFVNRGLAWQNAGDSTAALKNYRHALTLNPEHTLALHNLAVFNRMNQKKTATADPLELAIESDSSMLHPYLERARQRLEGGFYKGALEDYNQALKLEDQDPEIWLSRGLVHERLKDLSAAFSDYTRAIELKEDFVKAWINRANVLLKQERYKDAVEDYSVALIYTPDSGAAYYNRAIAKNYLKLNTEACADLKRAEELGMAVDDKIKQKFCEQK